MRGVAKMLMELKQRMEQGHMRGVAKMLMERAAPEKLPAETEDQGLVGMLTVHQRSQWFHAQKRYQEALESRQRSVDLLLPPTSQGLLGPDTQHLMPVLKAFLGSLRDLCILLDDIERATAVEPNAHLHQFNKTIATRYANILKDDDRNFACISLYIMGWQCAYVLDTTAIVRKWRLPDIPLKLADQITHKYWKGMQAFSSNNWTEACQDLSFVFRMTPPRFHKHRRIVLHMLIPAQLANCLSPQKGGGLPTADLLARYGLEEFKGLVSAFELGDVRAFERNLVQYEDFYVRKKILLQLTKLRLLLYRNLLKRACNVIFAHDNVSATQTRRISLQLLCSVVKAGGWDVDLTELECVLGLLIKRKHVNGKLDKEREAIIFPPKNSKSAFPSAAGAS
eukprot:Tamp_19028.p1 GENE.Tamp_19028~~Tamp_19028.p1  ORF type:complete len:395 (-),score=77.38 Tamp_19028:98-1282(-)